MCDDKPLNNFIVRGDLVVELCIFKIKSDLKAKTKVEKNKTKQKAVSKL